MAPEFWQQEQGDAPDTAATQQSLTGLAPPPRACMVA